MIIDEIYLVNSLVKLIPKGKYTKLVTTGRGGLALMANLAYSLGIEDVDILDKKELYQLIDESTLFIDNIVDSGATLQSVLIDSACLAVRYNTTSWPTYHALTIENEDYIVFPLSQALDEEWRELPFKSFTGLRYWASSLGNIRSDKGPLKKVTIGDYLGANIKDGNQHKLIEIHRLVAIVFLNYPSDGLQVDHKDDNPYNNHISNLQLLSPKNNARKALAKTIHQFTLTGEYIQSFPCVADVRKVISGDISGVFMCARGDQKTAKGFRWSYVLDKENKNA